jgi:hypothetical protein
MSVAPPGGSLTSAFATRVLLLLLLLAALLLAAVGQRFFIIGHHFFSEHEFLQVRYRNLGVLSYALMLIPLLMLYRRVGGRLLGDGRATWRTRALLLLLLVLGAGMRFHRLHELPPGCWDDEGLNGTAAVRIAKEGMPRVVSPDDPRPGLAAGYINIAAVAFRLFDPDDGPYTLRATAAALGILSLTGIAVSASMLFGPTVALAATGWAAVAQYHVNYSRLGWEQLTSSLVETWMLVGLAVGFRRSGWRAWLGILLAGSMYGLGFYSYQNYRLFIVLATLIGLIVALKHWRIVRTRLPHAVVAGVLALNLAFPMLHYAVTHRDDFTARARDTMVFYNTENWSWHLREAVSKSLLAFHYVGDENPRHNLPWWPLLSAVPAVLMAIGLTVSVCRARRSLACAVVPLWFFLGVIPGAITYEPPHASRLLDAIVPIALMIGIAVDFIYRTLQVLLPQRLGMVVGAVGLAAAATVTASREYQMYFVERLALPIYHDAFLPYEAAPGRYLQRQSPEGIVYLDPKAHGSPTTRFIARRFFDDPSHDVRMMRVMHEFFPTAPVSKPVHYVLAGPYTPMVPVLRAMYPAATLVEMRSPFGRIDLAVVHAEADDVNRFREQLQSGAFRWPYGLRGRYFKHRGEGAKPYFEAVLPFLFCDYDTASEPIGPFLYAEWDGYIRIARAGEHYFRLHPDSADLTIGGQDVIRSSGAEAIGADIDGRITLAEGVYPIRIRFEKRPEVQYLLSLHWHPPGEEPAWVPSSVLIPPEETPPAAEPRPSESQSG